MQAVAYVRVSTDDQVKGTSLDSQTEAVIKYAKNLGLELPSKNIFREEGESATLASRPQLNELLKFCALNRGDISHCVVWKLDRLARRVEHHVMIKQKLTKYGVKLESTTESISDDWIGAAMENMLTMFAQIENDMRKERTVTGMKSRAKQGAWSHDAPFGYDNTRTKEGLPTITPNEDSQKVVKLFEKYSGGFMTVEEARNFAYEIGIRDKYGKKKSWQLIKSMLKNPVYAGYVKTKFTEDEMIDGIHEGIVSLATLHRNMTLLDDQSRKIVKYKGDDWALRGGFIRCGYCDKALTGSSPKGRNKYYPIYHCIGCKKSTDKPRLSKPRDVVHKEFIDLLESIRPSEDIAVLFRATVLKKMNSEFSNSNANIAKLNNRISSLNEKRSKILDLFIEGQLNEADKKQKLAEIDVQVASVELKRSNYKDIESNAEEILDGAMLFIENPGLFWNLNSAEVKRRVQYAIFPEGIVYDFGKGFGTAKLAESYLLIEKIARKGDPDSLLVAGAGLEPATFGL